jgi:hypothetical protein
MVRARAFSLVGVLENRAMLVQKPREAQPVQTVAAGVAAQAAA